MTRYQSVVAARLVLRRQKLGIKQSDLLFMLKEKMGSNARVSASTLSHWETGYRKVPDIYVTALAEILQCTEEFLLGISDDPDSREPADAEDNMLHEIPLTMLYKYDQQPVYVEFLDFAHEDSWGIFDRDTNTIYFIRFQLFLGKTSEINIRISTEAPDYSRANYRGRSILDLRKVMLYDAVYVRINSNDRSVQNLYNGLYKHNENRTALINSEGLVLPYSGCNKNYVCFSTGEMDPNEEKYIQSREKRNYV